MRSPGNTSPAWLTFISGERLWKLKTKGFKVKHDTCSGAFLFCPMWDLIIEKHNKSDDIHNCQSSQYPVIFWLKAWNDPCEFPLWPLRSMVRSVFEITDFTPKQRHHFVLMRSDVSYKNQEPFITDSLTFGVQQSYFHNSVFGAVYWMCVRGRGGVVYSVLSDPSWVWGAEPCIWPSKWAFKALF